MLFAALFVSCVKNAKRIMSSVATKQNLAAARCFIPIDCFGSDVTGSDFGFEPLMGTHIGMNILRMEKIFEFSAVSWLASASVLVRSRTQL